jgi:hypothetical protein
MAESQDTFAKTCGACGRPLAGPVNFCPYCGSKISLGDEKRVTFEPHDSEIEPPQTSTFNITASSGPNGRISPESSAVGKGSSLTVTVIPDAGYRIGTISIDGKPLDPVPSYTFETIDANHSIEASFSRLTFTIIYRKDGKEHDRFSVEYGSGKIIPIITPDGYQLKDVLFDGLSQGIMDYCRFEGVTSNHVVEALFEKLPRIIDDGKEEKKEDGKRSVGKGTWVTVIGVVVLLLAVVAFYFFGKPKQAEVEVVSTPGGAEVMLDGKLAGKTPLVLKGIAVGRHALEFSKKGRRQTLLEIELTAGRNPDIKADLPKQEPPKLPTIPPPTSPPEVKPVTPPAKPEDKPIEKPIETPIEARIEEAIDLYDNQQYAEAAGKLKAILEVVPNNALAKFYLKRSLDAGK